MNKWRFIDSGFGEPLYNMKLDEALLNNFDLSKSLPVFRLYRWVRPAISLGRFQEAGKALNLEKCRKDGLSIVKRVSGGFGLYHSQEELTYSLVCPADFLASLPVKDSYKKITSFLMGAYRQFGFKPQYAKDYLKQFSAGKRQAFFCLSDWQEYDILIKGKKIGGNAQRRKKKVIFQHGSIPFRLPKALESYFLIQKNAGNAYTSLSELGLFDFDRFKRGLIDSFQKSLGVKLILEPAKDKELKYAASFS